MAQATAETAYEFLQVNLTEGVYTITLNRPDNLNSFNDEMSFELQKALKEAEKSSDVRCVVLTGAGRAFSAGQDLKARSIQVAEDGVPHLGESIKSRYAPIISKIRNMEKPVIAKINGVAAGAGASIAFACDIKIAVDTASFIQAFVKVGLIPDSGACWLLPRLVGLSRAFELAMLGDKIDTRQAVEYGLINHYVTAEDLDATVDSFAKKLANSPTKAIGLMKRAFNKAMTSSLDDYLDYEAEVQEIAGRTQDYQEGVAAFTEKRDPSFIGS